MSYKATIGSLAGMSAIALSCIVWSTTFADSSQQTIITTNAAAGAAYNASSPSSTQASNLPVVALIYGTVGTNIFDTPVTIDGVKVSNPNQISYTYQGSTANPQFSQYKGQTYKLCAVFDGSKESYGFIGVGASTGGYKSGATGWGPNQPLTNPTIKSNNYSTFGSGVKPYCGTITAIQYLYLKPKTGTAPLAADDYATYATAGYPANGGMKSYALPVNVTASSDNKSLTVNDAADSTSSAPIPQGVFIPLAMPGTTSPFHTASITLSNAATASADDSAPAVQASVAQVIGAGPVIPPTTNVVASTSSKHSATAVISSQAVKK